MVKSDWIIKKIIYIVLLSAFLISFGFTNQWNKKYGESFEKYFNDKVVSFERVSVFVSREKGFDKEKISHIRNNIYEKLKKSPALERDSDKVFLDAYSAADWIQISNENNYIDCHAIFIGGNYFDFHNTAFLSGSKFSADDLMQDKAVISETLAFQLFGSNDCIGKILWMNDNAFVVNGVVADGDSFIKRQVGEAKEKIYLSYEMMSQAGCDKSVISYEIILPEPIHGFAQKTVEEALQIDFYNRKADLLKNEMQIRSESNRFQIGSLIKAAFKLNDRAVRTIPLQFPDWENERIIVENYIILIFIFRVIIILLFLIKILNSFVFPYIRKQSNTTL